MVVQSETCAVVAVGSFSSLSRLAMAVESTLTQKALPARFYEHFLSEAAKERKPSPSKLHHSILLYAMYM
jgi:hypothetical protein